MFIVIKLVAWAVVMLEVNRNESKEVLNLQELSPEMQL